MDITVKNFLSIVLCIAATMLVTSCEEEDAAGGDANSFTLARSKAVVEGLN